MIEKCSIGNMTNNIQNITLILLILILIIVIIYYLKNSNAKHNELIEKYTNTPIESDASYITHYSANSQKNSNFPSTGTTVTLRDCQVQFNNTFDGNENSTVKYTYADEWKEIDTLTEPGSSPIRIPEKIISRSNETNAADITNYSERTKCFRRMTASDNKYRYAGNNLIQYTTGSASVQGIHSELKVGTDGTPDNYMEMTFNLDPSNSDNYYNNLTSSICSLQYTNNLGGNNGSGLGNLSLYRLTLNAANTITAINQITINSTNNHIFTVSSTTSFADLLTSTSTKTYVYSDGNFIFKNNSSLSSATNSIGVKIYRFNRELLCSHVQNNIKSYTIIDNKVIDANKIVNVSAASVSRVINDTKFPNAATSYTSKDAVKTAIEQRINTEIATANADAISEETTANNNIATKTGERDAFLTSINTRDKYLDKLFDDTLVASKRNFLVKIGSLELNTLGYQTLDVSSDEIILSSSEEPSFSKIVNNTPTVIYTIETYTDTSVSHKKTFNTDTVCEILIVGGGGGGGSRHGGGGGGGSVIHLTNQLFNATTYTINVGSGGAGATAVGQGNIGGDSSITLGSTTKYLAKGGGAGMHWENTGYDKLSGGSGGGGGKYVGSAVNTNIPSGTYGTSGCLGTSGGYEYNWGGGGGGGASITDKCSNSSGSVAQAGNGGNGVQILISGKPTYYGGGGGGGAFNNTNNKAGKGGLGGGGDGSIGYANASHGLPNTGGGGGGGGFNGGHSSYGGNGGSGIVIFKYINKAEQNGNEKQITLKYNNDNLVAWYKFDGDFNDSSGNGHNLINRGTTTQTTHVIDGQAVTFDNTNYLEFPDTINPYTIWNGNGITFSFWVRFTAHSNWARLIDIQTGTQAHNGVLISANSTHDGVGSGPALSFWCNGSVFYYYNNDLLKKLGDWHHIVFSIDKFGKWDIYLNNVRINNTEVAPVPNIPYNLRYINKSVYWWDGQWKGQIDEFRIYNKALNDSEVSRLYNKIYTIPSNVYRTILPMQTAVTLNGTAKTLEAGTYYITMGPTSSEIKNRGTNIVIGNYAHRDGDKLEFKYATKKTLEQIHNDTSVSSSAALNTINNDLKYSLGYKTAGTIIKYRAYIYKRHGVLHTLTLYADNILLTNGTQYVANGTDEEAVSKKIYLYNYDITINDNISGNIYLRSDNPIFFISEASRTSFNNTTDTEFGTNVNKLKASGIPTSPSLNDIFGVSEATTALTTARGKQITYNIDSRSNSESPLTINYNSSTINPAGRNSLDNLKTTYNNIHRYNESSGGALTEKINEHTFGNIFDPVETDIEEYISYEYPTAPTDDKLTPSSRNTAFDIRSNATKYVYFRKSS